MCFNKKRYDLIHTDKTVYTLYDFIYNDLLMISKPIFDFFEKIYALNLLISYTVLEQLFGEKQLEEFCKREILISE